MMLHLTFTQDNITTHYKIGNQQERTKARKEKSRKFKERKNSNAKERVQNQWKSKKQHNQIKTIRQCSFLKHLTFWNTSKIFSKLCACEHTKLLELAYKAKKYAYKTIKTLIQFKPLYSPKNVRDGWFSIFFCSHVRLPSCLPDVVQLTYPEFTCYE